MPTTQPPPPSPSSGQRRILAAVRKLGVLRPRDLDRLGVPRSLLQRLEARGLVQRVGRGLYSLPGDDLGENATLAAAARRVPAGVVCLLSALRLHDLTTQAPFEVWMAIDHKARTPSVADLPLRVVRFSGQALATGIEERRVGGVIVRFYSAAKTVADCFKFRNKIGLDVALEALREYLRHRKGTVDDLWRSARVCRVENVMRPYLEALVGSPASRPRLRPWAPSSSPLEPSSSRP